MPKCAHFSFFDAWDRRRTPFSLTLAASLVAHALILALIPGLPKAGQSQPWVLRATLLPPAAGSKGLAQVPAPPEHSVAPGISSQPVRRPERTAKPRARAAVVRKPSPPVISANQPSKAARAPAVPPALPDVPDTAPAQEPLVKHGPDGVANNPMTGMTAAAPVQAREAESEAIDDAAVAAAESARRMDALASYGRALSEAIGRHQRYPRIAQLRHWQGTTLLDLAIDAEGRLLEVRVARSSGHDVLDQSAIEMARAATPLPRPSGPLASLDLKLNVPVVFKLVR